MYVFLPPSIKVEEDIEAHVKVGSKKHVRNIILIIVHIMGIGQEKNACAWK